MTRHTYFAYNTTDESKVIVKFRDLPGVTAAGITLKEAMFRACDNLKAFAMDNNLPEPTEKRPKELAVSIVL
jgi:predicted RNase H-like HicB family nuclease